MWPTMKAQTFPKRSGRLQSRSWPHNVFGGQSPCANGAREVVYVGTLFRSSRNAGTDPFVLAGCGYRAIWGMAMRVRIPRDDVSRASVDLAAVRHVCAETRSKSIRGTAQSSGAIPAVLDSPA